VDLLAMKLYDPMIEGEEHSTGYKGAIQQTIKKQALINFQIDYATNLKYSKNHKYFLSPAIKQLIIN